MRRVTGDRAVRLVRQGRRSRAGPKSSRRSAPRSTSSLICLDKDAFEVACLEGRALLGHQFDDGAGVALVDGVAELVGFLAAGANDAAAMVALVGLGPSRQLQVVALEVVGAAGVGIDLRRDDMEVGIALVIVGGEQRAGIAHAHRGKGACARPVHLLARRLLAGSPAERQVDAIHLATAGAAGLVLGVEFHDAARQVGVLAALDLEAEIRCRRTIRRGSARPSA